MARGKLDSAKGECGPTEPEWSEPTLVNYEFRFGTRKQRTAEVRLGIPRLDDIHHGEWVCAFQVKGLQDDRIKIARSTDGLQVVTIASNVIWETLDKVKGVYSPVVPYWVEFPRYLPFCYGSTFHRHLCNLVDIEVEKEERRLAKRRSLRKKRRR
ncbi:hypothetical protein QA639_29975 [Bradyrhizobium pachyrhizi]|uniref:hypothetical protein n=1 Tax=Bradyrhizobium pachyrhizi TaxID=280333 RepID=UPI0024B280DB|nr:hypothetical protein [Bradyrhizobium pachyrhizi]WFU53862.1 hypothetical protein QA639_29975 [Bradyrhizobium pachyrhizi]